MSDVKQVALASDGSCKYCTSIALKADGSVWAWGYDGHGMDSKGVTKPQKMASGAKSIAAASYCRLAYVLKDGSCYINNSQLEDIVNFTTFKKKASSTRSVAFSYTATYRLDASGRLYSWGASNSRGELGNGKQAVCKKRNGIVVKASSPIKVTVPQASARRFVWNGKARKVQVASGIGYSVSGVSRATDVGTYALRVKLWKGFIWSDGSSADKVITWKIERAKLGSAKLEKTGLVYTGKRLQPSVVVKSGGKTLKKGRDYTVKYQANKSVGVARVTVTGKGNYASTKRLSFTISPKPAVLVSVSGGKGKLTAKWAAQVKQVDGYELRYSTSKSMNGARKKTIDGAKTTKVSLKNLEPGKTYYAQLRTYKTVRGTAFYSAWSKAKSAKVKGGRLRAASIAGV